MSNSKKIPLNGTQHVSLPGARALGPTDPHQLIEISVLLKHRKPLPKPEEEERILNHSEFAKMYGADPAHVDKIRQFARENNLQALERGDEVYRRTVTLAGTAAAMEKAFCLELTEFEFENGSYRGHAGAIQLPEECASMVCGIFGLDTRPVAHPHIRYRNSSHPFGTRASTTSYTPVEVARLYGFPKDANGAGQTIGLIELGGGYRPTDIHEYFRDLGLQPPAVRPISVNHAENRPTSARSADSAVMLDIEVAGAVAPGSSIAVYFAPNDARGFQDALSTAIHDQLNKPHALSISWGNPEVNWTDQSMENFDMLAQEAALLGITITVAAGENHNTDMLLGGKNHVDFPASCPYVLAAGGTRMVAANGSIDSETVWNDGTRGGATGGGYSKVFPRPSWQPAVAAQAGRGVPDVAANAAPETGYNILVDGQREILGGTGAAAPLWAGLVTVLNQKLNQRLGFLNPTLYKLDHSSGFRDVNLGSNGAHKASIGWDPVTGQGTPIGTQLLQALQGSGAQTRPQKKEAQTHALAAH